jgi:hypothetical protein
MDTRHFQEGDVISVNRGGRRLEATVAKDSPYREDFPFVLVVLEERKLLVNRKEIEEGE